MITMNELVDFRMQQHIAQEIYRQQIMQRIPDPFSSMLPMGMPHQVLMPPRPTLPGVEAKLENDELWKQFHKIGTEMIITKTGRRMFPSMRLSLSGLEEETNYCVLLEMVPIGDCRYKFSGTQWVPAGGAEPQSPQRMYLHPDSPATGAHWQAQPILFSKAKLTNNTLDNNGHIVLASMHKYQPRLHVIRTSDLTQIPWAPQQAFVFPETEFVAVTAYQNDRITKLKIDHNPFAKGFRETGQSRCKRKMSTSPTLDDRSEPPISKASSDDDRTSVSSYDVPQIKRMRSNESANSVSSLEEGSRNVGGPCLESSNTSPHTSSEDINACALRYINAMEANLRSPLVDFSRSYYPQHLQPSLAYHQPTNQLVGQNLFPPQIDYSRHNFPYPRLEQESSFADSSNHKDDDNDSQSSAQSDEQCTDTFVDVVSTTEDHHQQPVDDEVECKTPVVVAAKRNSFTISAILGGRNVVAV